MGGYWETTWLDLNWDLARRYRQYNQLHSHIIKVQRVVNCIVCIDYEMRDTEIPIFSQNIQQENAEIRSSLYVLCMT
jgi:hypothetical protein